MPQPPPDPLAAWAAADPSRPTLVEARRVTGYAELNAEVNRLVNGLRSLGMSSGETAVWCSPNSGRVVAFMHACRKLGLVAVPLSYRLTPEEMLHVIDDSGASLVAVAAEQAVIVAGVVDRVPGCARRWSSTGPDPRCAAGSSPPLSGRARSRPRPRATGRR